MSSGSGPLEFGLLGQGDEYDRVLRAAAGGRLHHGLLVTGGRGVGKTTAARHVAAALLCTGPPVAAGQLFGGGSEPGSVPCGQCAACRHVHGDQHPDLHWLTVAEGKQDISIDQVRALQETLGRQAYSGAARVAIIDPVDRLTEQGQNALLKTLEEPGDRVHLLLPTARPQQLLDTVRSRVATLRIRGLAAEALASMLADRGLGSDEDRAVAVALGRGSLGYAAALLEAGIPAVHQQVVAFLQGGTQVSEVSLARLVLDGVSGTAATEQRARYVLGAAASWVRDVIAGSLAQAGGEAYGAVLSPWTCVLEILQEAEADLQLRIRPEQVICAALLRITEATAVRASS